MPPSKASQGRRKGDGISFLWTLSPRKQAARLNGPSDKLSQGIADLSNLILGIGKNRQNLGSSPCPLRAIKLKQRCCCHPKLGGPNADANRSFERTRLSLSA